MVREEIVNSYFEWLFNLLCRGRYSDKISYRKLLTYLHHTEFIYLIKKDENRAEDGLNLRYRFAQKYDYDDVSRYLDEPCSVLEMMTALAIRCEETIMDNPNMGDRMGQWFWEMIVSLGLGSMLDDRFDKCLVESILRKFLNREYAPDGRGGLFTIRNCSYDLRDVEIWYQLCWYLDTIV